MREKSACWKAAEISFIAWSSVHWTTDNFGSLLADWFERRPWFAGSKTEKCRSSRCSLHCSLLRSPYSNTGWCNWPACARRLYLSLPLHHFCLWQKRAHSPHLFEIALLIEYSSLFRRLNDSEIFYCISFAILVLDDLSELFGVEEQSCEVVESLIHWDLDLIDTSNHRWKPKIANNFKWSKESYPLFVYEVLID